MIKRRKKPWQDHWNGVGGHIEPGEDKTLSVYREILEETGIDLKKAKRVQYKGIVTWNHEAPDQLLHDETAPIEGMHAFLAYLAPTQAVWENEQETREGTLAWKTIDWVCDVNNKEVAHNVPYFLPDMLQSDSPKRYHCTFKQSVLQKVEIVNHFTP